MAELIRKEVPFSQVAQQVVDQMQNGGIFLTTSASNAKPNTMTLGWGGIGPFFNLPVFYAAVRPSRHSFWQLKRSNEFTISVPLHGMQQELTFAGTASGRDVDKLDGHGLTAAPGWELATPIIKECGLHLECRVVSSPTLTPINITPEIAQRFYPEGDLHTLFLGQIVRCYYTK